MRALACALLALGALALAACGGKPAGRGEAAFLGKWTLSYLPLLESRLALALAANQKSLSGVPAEQLEHARELQPSAEQLREEIKNGLEATESVLEIRADATYTHTTTIRGKVEEVGSGAWHQVGPRVTLVPKTLNEQSVDGRQAAPVHLTFEGGVLSMRPSPKDPPLLFRRAAD